MRRIAVFGYFAAALASCASAARNATEAIGTFIAAALMLAVRTVADKFDWRVPLGFTVATDGPALTYDAPPVHRLRHEAGMSRRAAPRHI